MTVYLIHFDEPIAPDTKDGRRTLHYVGWTRAGRLRRRLEDHAAGRGARLTQVAAERGIGWRLARTWPNGDRALEVWIKRSGQRYRFCPICCPATRSGLAVDTTVRMRWKNDDGQFDVRRVVFSRPKVRRPIRFVCEGGPAAGPSPDPTAGRDVSGPHADRVVVVDGSGHGN